MSAYRSYVNPTVALVALELRHPESNPISTLAQAKLKQLLSVQLPLFRPVTTNTIQATPNTQPIMTSETDPRYLNRDRTASVTYRKSSIQVETTRYTTYADFRKLARLAMSARQEVDKIDGVERLGIRYINEIRAPDGGPDLASWEPWISHQLLGPATFAEPDSTGPTHMQALVTYQVDESANVALRYGVAEGYAVDPGGELKRPTPPPTSFFLLDIDSFWMATNDIPEFSVEEIVATCDRVHTPVRKLFDAVTTDRLRKEVLGEQ